MLSDLQFNIVEKPLASRQYSGTALLMLLFICTSVTVNYCYEAAILPFICTSAQLFIWWMEMNVLKQPCICTTVTVSDCSCH